MPDAREKLPTPQQLGELRALAAKHGISPIRYFGSHAREDTGPESDVDLLVDIEYGKGVAMRLVRFYREVRELLGVDVDILTEDALDRRLHARILREARPI